MLSWWRIKDFLTHWEISCLIQILWWVYKYIDWTSTLYSNQLYSHLLPRAHHPCLENKQSQFYSYGIQNKLHPYILGYHVVLVLFEKVDFFLSLIDKNSFAAGHWYINFCNSYVLPYYRKLTLREIKVLEINTTQINANLMENDSGIKKINSKELVEFHNKGN